MNRATGSTAFAMQINEMAQEINKLRADLAAERELRAIANRRMDRAEAERDALRALLREAGDWIVPSSEADEFCARIDAALNNGGGDE